MFEHFKGEEVFVKKVLEFKDQALYKQRIILTKFLNPYHQSIVYSIIGNLDDLIVLEDGGLLNSESKRLIIAPSFYQIEKEDFEIALVKITYVKSFGKLNHRDILGALMSLGIKRELFGDIYEYNDNFYVAMDSRIYDYVKDNLTMIKRSKVKLSITNEKIEIIHEYVSKTFIISSFRLDKIVSSFYKIPRSKAVSYIQAGFVKVNHKEVEEISYLCNNSDIISLRRYGRVKFVDTKRKTKQDNFVVEGYFYKYGSETMSEIKKQFRGYDMQTVDNLIVDYESQISKLKREIATLTDELEHAKEQNSLLQHRVNITEKTNEEIARLALKEASALIDKAKRNANMILKESLDYVRSLSSEMNDFKDQAIKFRSSVQKMSQDILDTIDNSEVFNLINEEDEDN